ncbi:amidase [Terrabacter tumescens]|uniref:Amidase n=1 Tax=Terrabacter tumescens TaxID=60443 RepID=A0ABQ2I950_9MICO|nr:amidase [Terrabacter tumescens]GGN02302.1 amidase [Terrabacter tumescens]
MERPAARTATDLLLAYAAGSLSPVDVVRDVAEVVASREPTLNAFHVHDLDAAHEEAEASERRWRDGIPQGPLDGIPATVKENLGRAGVPMPLGNAGVTPVVPVRSCPVVERLEEAGAILLGSTVMPDWGMLSSGVSSLHGITRSPWDESLTTGGSSSGAGAAAAAGYGPLHVGTDIGGSIRLPGTWLGLTTLKPSAGRVPLDVPYLGRVAGPITRSADDAALLLSVISRPDARDWTSLPPEVLPSTPDVLDPVGLRVGLHLDAGCGLPVDPDVRTAVEEAAAVFADAGAVVTPLEPFLRQSWLEDLDQFWRVRSLVDLDALPAAAQERVLPFIRRWAEGARKVDGVDVLRDYTSIMAIQQATVAATERYDLVLSPVAPMPAFPAEWPMPWGDGDAAMPHIGFTAPYNLSGQPAGTTNCGFTADGRTIGVQVSGRRFDDVGVLAALAWFEAHRSEAMLPRWPIRS